MREAPKPVSSIDASAERITLTLFISSYSVTTPLTVDSIVRLCRALGEESCQLDVVDVVTHPEIAEQYDVVATPTLIRHDETLSARVVGDLSSRSVIATCLLPELLDVDQQCARTTQIIGRISCA